MNISSYFGLNFAYKCLKKSKFMKFKELNGKSKEQNKFNKDGL